MNIPVTLRVNKVDITANATLKLPKHCYNVPFKVVSHPVIEYDINPEDPERMSDNIYLLCVNGCGYKIVFGKETTENLILTFAKNYHTLQLVACCPGTQSLQEELYKTYDHRLVDDWLKLNDDEIKELTRLMAHTLLTYDFRTKGTERVNLESDSSCNPTDEGVKELNQLTGDPVRVNLESDRSRDILFSSDAVLSDITITPTGISTKRKTPTFYGTRTVVRVPDYNNVLKHINKDKLRTGSYNVEELKTFLSDFNVTFQSDRLSKATLENLLICFTLAYQGKGTYCATEKLRDFLILFGFKVEDTDTNITECFLRFVGLKNVITINIDDLENKSQEELNQYYNFFGLIGENQRNVKFFKSNLGSIL